MAKRKDKAGNPTNNVKNDCQEFQDDVLDLMSSIKNWLIVISVLLAILTCVVGFRNFCNCNCSCGEDVVTPQIDPNQGDYVEPEVEVDHSKNVIMPGWTKIAIPANTKEITTGVDFYNPEGNKWYKCPDCGAPLDANYKCTDEKCGHQHSADDAVEFNYYMTFKLVLSDTNETIYESGLVAPGKHLQHITLTKALKAGEYDAYVFLQPYMDDQVTPCNNGKVVVKLIVQ